MRVALYDFVQAAIASEWCVDQCIDSGLEMAECARLCRDVADLADENIEFLARDSPFGADLAEVYAYAAEAAAQECERHQTAHCQECATALRRSVNSTRELLDSLGHRSQLGAGGQQGEQGIHQRSGAQQQL